jgi:hypothetical protein
VMFYGDCVKMCKDFAQNFGDKIAAWCFATTHRLTLPFHREFLTKINVTVVPHPLYFSLFPWRRINWKAAIFDIIEVIVAESQVVLNSLTKHYFEAAFQKWQKSWERCVGAEGD